MWQLLNADGTDRCGDAPVHGQTVAGALRVRSTVRGMRADANPSFTLRQFVEEAFAAYCRLLEDRYHDGKPWPEVDNPLAAGRPGGH